MSVRSPENAAVWNRLGLIAHNEVATLPVAKFDEALDLARDLSAGQVDDLKRQIEALESLRPHWAQGYTDDGVAAQTMSVALSGLWALLGVDNQTAAVAKLKELLA